MRYEWLIYCVLGASAQAAEPVGDPLLDAYDAVRVALVADRLDDARVMAKHLEQVSQLPAIDASAAAIVASADLDDARRGFGELSRELVLYYAAAPTPPAVHVYHCLMTNDWPYWLQRGAGIGNPYMGVAMPSCGEGTSLKAAARAAGAPVPAPHP